MGDGQDYLNVYGPFTSLLTRKSRHLGYGIVTLSMCKKKRDSERCGTRASDPVLGDLGSAQKEGIDSPSSLRWHVFRAKERIDRSGATEVCYGTWNIRPIRMVTRPEFPNSQGAFIMHQLKNAMEIFKILPRTNCRDCRLPTCLAFAAAVFKGDKRLADCPHVETSALEAYSVQNSDSRTLEREEQHLLAELRSQVQQVDFAASTQRLGATLSDDKLTIKMLGKDFQVDREGTVTSICHVHGWVTVPLLKYVIHCAGKPVSGNWVPLRELKTGASWGPLFSQRCEKPLKRIADTHTDLFEHMVEVFSAKRTLDAFDADIAVMLYPLPKVPMLICYWKPEDDMESGLNVFFDKTAEENLDMDSLYRLGAGVGYMFEKISITHGF